MSETSPMILIFYLFIPLVNIEPPKISYHGKEAIVVKEASDRWTSILECESWYPLRLATDLSGKEQWLSAKVCK